MAYDREAARAEYEYYVKLKICTACHCNDARPNKRFCFDCAEINNERDAKRYAAMTPEEKKQLLKKNTERARKLRQERAEKGVCTKCGICKPRENRKTCTVCGNIDSRNNRKKYQKKRKNVIPLKDRNQLGLCLYCCEPLEHRDDKLCKFHHEKRSEQTKAIQANPTSAMLKAREDFVKRDREFRDKLFYAPQIQKQANRAAIENFKRVCALCI